MDKGNQMVITLAPELETALVELARRRGVAPEVLASIALRDWLDASTERVRTSDDWEAPVASGRDELRCFAAPFRAQQ